jgi:carboxyl-terminal processing protease
MWTLSLAFLCAVAWCLSSRGVPTGPQRGDASITITVKGCTERDHLSRHPVDDEISKRAMKTFLESFDPRKLYFLQTDIDEFHKKDTLLDDEMRRGKVDFAYEVFKRFLLRMEERVKLVEELTQQEFDFSVNEELVTDPDALQYPRDEAEARDRWRKLIKYNLLVAKSDNDDLQEARAKILRRYQKAARDWQQTDADELLELFLTSITSSFDPHTSYMSASTLENFNILMRLNLDGIGAALQRDEEGYTIISKIIPRGAADKHGQLKPDDRIVSVGQGENGEMEDVTDMRLDDVVKKIRGPAGTVVRLGVRTKGSSETKIYNITRAKVELEDSAARSEVLERGQKADGSAYRIGWIDLPSFYLDMKAARENGNSEYRSTTRDVSRILDEFNSKGVELVVLDLRWNGGGSLTEAIQLTGLFVDGPIVQVKDSDGRVQVYDDNDGGVAWKGPLVVLASKFSASASEIFAGAIQDYGRGIVVGDETTHGKGTVQNLLEIGRELLGTPNPPNYGALKVTVQQFYRPNGDSTQKRGVLSDIVLPSLTNLIGTSEAELDYAVEFGRVRASRFAANNLVPVDVVSRLKDLSQNRVRSSSDFAKLEKDIERYQRYKKEKSIPLNEEQFQARRAAERDAEKEQKEQMDAQNGKKDVVYKDEFYNREVTQIAVDYLTELSRQNLAQAR